MIPRPQGPGNGGAEAAHRSDAQTWPPPAASPSLCNLLQVAYRTVLPRRAVARSRRRLCGLPHPGTLGTRQPPRSLRLQKTPRPRVRPAARGWARPGRGGAGGRGGDATARGRAGERAGAQRLLRCGGRRAAPVRSARTVPGVGRGAQAETQRTGRPLLRHFLPARGFRREREARFCYWFFFLPSFGIGAGRRGGPRAACGGSAARRGGAPLRAPRPGSARAGSGGLRPEGAEAPPRWGGLGVSARAPERKLAGWVLGLLIFPAARPRRLLSHLCVNG